MKRLALTALFTGLLMAASPHTNVWAQDADATESDDAESGTDDAAEVTAEAEDSQASEDSEKKKTLADRVKSVQRKQFIKKSRIEVFPHFGLDLNDPFYQHFILGGSVAYHFADSMAAELRAGGVIGSVDQSAIRFVREETGSLINDPPEFKWHADIDFVWAPLYGKISLFTESILHFDTFVTVGPGVFATDANVNPSMNIGIGQRYFINEWLTARVEIRDYIFIDSRNGESDIQNLLILGFSVSGFFPMTFEYDYQ